MSNKLGRYMRLLRAGSGMTIREVESRSGVSNAYVSQLETGKVANPSVITLVKLATIYRVQVQDILAAAGWADQPGARRPGPLGTLTAAEEAALIEYLEFLRYRARRSPDDGA